MVYLLAFLFIRGPLIFRIFAWAFVAAILYTGIFLLFHSKPTLPKGTEPYHVRHAHAHPTSFIRR